MTLEQAKQQIAEWRGFVDWNKLGASCESKQELQKYFDEAVELFRKHWYDKGKDESITDSYNEGFEDGKDEKCDDRYDAGKEDGIEEGYEKCKRDIEKQQEWERLLT